MDTPRAPKTTTNYKAKSRLYKIQCYYLLLFIIDCFGLAEITLEKYFWPTKQIIDYYYIKIINIKTDKIKFKKEEEAEKIKNFEEDVKNEKINHSPRDNNINYLLDILLLLVKRGTDIKIEFYENNSIRSFTSTRYYKFVKKEIIIIGNELFNRYLKGNKVISLNNIIGKNYIEEICNGYPGQLGTSYRPSGYKSRVPRKYSTSYYEQEINKLRHENYTKDDEIYALRKELNKYKSGNIDNSDNSDKIGNIDNNQIKEKPIEEMTADECRQKLREMDEDDKKQVQELLDTGLTCEEIIHCGLFSKDAMIRWGFMEEEEEMDEEE